MKQAMKSAFKSIAKETGKINIVPTYENLLISYVRLYSSMDSVGKKMIEEEMSKIGFELDRILLNLKLKGVK